MPTIPIHAPCSPTSKPSNPLPTLLQTPSGLAILELQGTIHHPSSSPLSSDDVEIGTLTFPLYNPDVVLGSDTSWMKRVYLQIGQYQRLTGEVKKLNKTIAVLQSKETKNDRDDGGEELEIVELVRYKIVFNSRPEPVGLDA